MNQALSDTLHPSSSAPPPQPAPSCRTPAALRCVTSCAMTFLHRQSARCISGERLWTPAPTASTSPWRTPAAWPWPAPLSPSTSPRMHLVGHTQTCALISHPSSQTIYLTKSILLNMQLCRKLDGLLFCVSVVSKTSHAAEVVLSSTAVLVAVFAFIAYLVCRWAAVTCEVEPSSLNICVSLRAALSFHRYCCSHTLSSLPGGTRCTDPFAGRWWRTPATVPGSEVGWSAWGRRCSPPARRAITCWLTDAPCRLRWATPKHFCLLVVKSPEILMTDMQI